MRWIITFLLLVSLICSVPSAWSTGATQSSIQDDKSKETRPPITRAARPKFTPREVSTLFFEDIFADALVGERPDAFANATTVAANDQGNSDPNSSSLFLKTV